MFVYLIKSDENLYKIGYSKNVNKRLKQLKTANPNNLQIVETYKSAFPRKLENYLHNIFKHKRVSGEWFDLDISDINNFLYKCQIFEKNFSALKQFNNPFI